MPLLELCQVKHYFVRKGSQADHAGRPVINEHGVRVGEVIKVVKGDDGEFLVVRMDFPIFLCSLDDGVPVSHVAFLAEA